MTLGLGVLMSAQATAKAAWDYEGDRGGIQVWSRVAPGSSKVEFRGRTVIDTNYKMPHILNLINDHNMIDDILSHKKVIIGCEYIPEYQSIKIENIIVLRNKKEKIENWKTKVPY